MFNIPLLTNLRTGFMRVILILGSALIVATVAYMLKDTSLSRSAAALTKAETIGTPDQSKSYRIVLGMHAAEQDDAYTVGGQLIASYRKASEGFSPLDEIAFSEYPDESTIYIPTADESELYCKVTDPGCFDQILADKAARDDERKRLSTIVERYIVYLDTNDFRSELAESVNTPWPEYRYVFAANRMRIFDAFDLVEKGNVDLAVEGMLEETRQLRQKLAASDVIIHKVITAHLIRDNLEAIAYVHSIGNGQLVKPIDYLTPQELSFEKPLQNEFFMTRDIIVAIDSEPEKLSEELEVPAWICQLLVQPNKLINRLADRINKHAELSRVDPAAFSAAFDDLDMIDDSNYSLSPTVDELMTNIIEVQYEDYIGRVFDLNAKIALVNAQITGETDSLVNPYYPDDEVTLHVDDDALNVCMDGPLPDEKHMRCLDIVSVNASLISRLD
jgi:hypothetical protein